MKRIALITNKHKDTGLNYTCEAIRTLEKHDCDICVSNEFEEHIRSVLPDATGAISFLTRKRVISGADVIVVLGGDGTILDAARDAIPKGIPILGINLGRVGYIAELEKDEIHLLDRLFTGEYKVRERMTLKIEIISGKSGEAVSCINSCALNDAVISHGTVSRIIDLRMFSGGDAVANYRADGLIIATPTGSTAYSMAAGGPILDPYIDCMCVTPICSHTLTARPIIFSGDETLMVENISEREECLYLTVDGRGISRIERGDFVRVTRSDKKAHLISMKESRFFSVLNNKLNSII